LGRVHEKGSSVILGYVKITVFFKENHSEIDHLLIEPHIHQSNIFFEGLFSAKRRESFYSSGKSFKI